MAKQKRIEKKNIEITVCLPYVSHFRSRAKLLWWNKKFNKSFIRTTNWIFAIFNKASTKYWAQNYIHTYIHMYKNNECWRQCRKYDPNWYIHFLYKFEIEQSTRSKALLQVETITITTKHKGVAKRAARGVMWDNRKYSKTLLACVGECNVTYIPHSREIAATHICTYGHASTLL